jgi:preprotein translocase subunit SecY
MSLSGTGIIIIVTASLELWSAIKSAATTSGYITTKKHIESTHTTIDTTSWQKLEQLW